ncbi:MAG: hypothetical protein LBK76_04615 [Verrucomicrobiales bacterium]|jgi:hypothetical protein|nr:hypothetical protein [Verrucomicrobiales bacterium]
MKKPIAKNQAAKLTKPVTVSGRLDAGVLTRKEAPKISPAAAESRAIIKALDNGADLEMGLQLTAQYQRAIGGMTEVLKFGAMMMRLREHLSQSPRADSVKLKRGKDVADGGIDGWLKRYAPQVKHATAYRFLHVAEAVLGDVKKQLPARVSFVELVTKPAAELSAKLQKKQLELFDYVSGTSQRSWLDMFRPKTPLGGLRLPAKKAAAADGADAGAAAAQAEQDRRALGVTAYTDLTQYLDRWFANDNHLHLTRDLRGQLADIFSQAIDKLKAVRD